MAAMTPRVIPWLPAAIRYKSSSNIIIMETVRLMWNVVWAVLHPFIEIALAIVATAAFWVIMTILIG